LVSGPRTKIVPSAKAQDRELERAQKAVNSVDLLMWKGIRSNCRSIQQMPINCARK
jgi:hypothetical protein